jgi:hypothetical protein
VLMDGFIQDGFVQAEGQYPRLTALGSKVLLLVCYSGFRSVTRYRSQFVTRNAKRKESL